MCLELDFLGSLSSSCRIWKWRINSLINVGWRLNDRSLKVIIPIPKSGPYLLVIAYIEGHGRRELLVLPVRPHSCWQGHLFWCWRHSFTSIRAYSLEKYWKKRLRWKALRLWCSLGTSALLFLSPSYCGLGHDCPPKAHELKAWFDKEVIEHLRYTRIRLTDHWGL